MKMKIYIAGKVTGLPIAETTMKFGKAQKQLEQAGFEVVNPLEVVNDWHAPWNIAMRKCIAALMTCDAVFLLPDWHCSKGAKIEMQLAQNVKIPVANRIDGLKKLNELNKSV